MSRAIDTRRHRAALPVFTPSAVSPEALAMRTVGRKAEIERLVRAIRTAATTDNRPHQLIVGPRGSGKSHLLIVALHEALADGQIADAVAVAMLPEDAVEIAGYDDLLVSVVDRTPGGSDERRDEARDARVRHDTAGIERMILELLGDRVLVLVIENLDRVFRDLGEQGQARLRNLTETSGKLLLLASTPLLFEAVSDHARPWYGSFDVEHLRELDAEEGRTLLHRVAVAAGDDELAASLDTPTGLARVKAVKHLAGGSPRMWTVLAGCITVDLLDELVPLVEALFDELAPYYQQRLWELAGSERKLVYELCRAPGSTVKDLAHATGLSQRAAATSLGRLHDASWVRREKRAGTDQRATWYSLREPLLRHHVEYRETGCQQLPAIVEFLRVWFESQELVAQLAVVSPTSPAERYVVAALSADKHPTRYGAWPFFPTLDELVTAARCWIATPGDGLASFAVGVVAEAVGLAAGGHRQRSSESLAARVWQLDDMRANELRAVVETAVAVANKRAGDPLAACASGLAAASAAGRALDDRDRIALGLLVDALGPGLSRTWFEAHEKVANRMAPDHDRLRLIFAAKQAFAAEARDLARATEVLLDCHRRLGPRDSTTLCVVSEGVGYTAAESALGPRASFAATAAQLMSGGGLVSELSFELMLMYLVLHTRPEAHTWLEVWTKATSGIGDLRPINHFLRRAVVATPPDLADLTPRDRAELAPAVEAAAAALEHPSAIFRRVALASGASG